MSPSAPASERGYGRVGDDDTSREERQVIYRKIHFERISETMPMPVPLPAFGLPGQPCIDLKTVAHREKRVPLLRVLVGTSKTLIISLEAIASHVVHRAADRDPRSSTK